MLICRRCKSKDILAELQGMVPANCKTIPTVDLVWTGYYFCPECLEGITPEEVPDGN